MALDTVFKTDSDAAVAPDSAVRLSNPREEDIVAELDDILNALSTEEAFVPATAAGGGVFESRELSASNAADAFNRVRWRRWA